MNLDSTDHDKQLYRIYIDRCIYNIICLKNLDKSMIDIIYIIINFQWQLRPKPVCVMFTFDGLVSLFDIRYTWQKVLTKLIWFIQDVRMLLGNVGAVQLLNNLIIKHLHRFVTQIVIEWLDVI